MSILARLTIDLARVLSGEFRAAFRTDARWDLALGNLSGSP